jgi:hypothetical protein
MMYKVTEIEFDFEDSLYPMTEEEKCDVYEEYIGTILQSWKQYNNVHS